MAASPTVLQCTPFDSTVKPWTQPIPPTGQHRVTLNWKASTTASNPAEKIQYCVYRKEKAEPAYTLITSTPVNAISCIDLRVQNGKTYTYAITAVDGLARQSGLSQPITTPPIPNTPGSGQTPINPPPSCWDGTQ